MIRINGIRMPTPSSFTCTIMDISNAERNAAGDMNIDRVTTKRKIEMEWKYLSLEDMSTVLNLVKDIFFEVEYPDPMEGKFLVKTFYVGDRTAPMLQLRKGKPYWQNIKFNLIER